VIFDFYFRDTQGAEAQAFIERSIAASERVQDETCRSASRSSEALDPPAYDRGIYAPSIEKAAYQFHRLLAADLAD